MHAGFFIALNPTTGAWSVFLMESGNDVPGSIVNSTSWASHLPISFTYFSVSYLFYTRALAALLTRRKTVAVPEPVLFLLLTLVGMLVEPCLRVVFEVHSCLVTT